MFRETVKSINMLNAFFFCIALILQNKFISVKTCPMQFVRTSPEQDFHKQRLIF